MFHALGSLAFGVVASVLVFAAPTAAQTSGPVPPVSVQAPIVAPQSLPAPDPSAAPNEMRRSHDIRGVFQPPGAAPLIGRVDSFHRNALKLKTRSGIVDVALHRGTILRPRGLTLVPQMLVTVRGRVRNGAPFLADEIVLGVPRPPHAPLREEPAAAPRLLR